MTGRTVSRRSTRPEGRPATTDRVVNDARQYLFLQGEVKSLSSRAGEIKDRLMTAVTAGGEPDEKGSLFLSLPVPIEANGKTYRSLKREKRTSKYLDEERTLELLHTKGLVDRVQKERVETYLDQDEIYVLNQEGLLTDEELDSLFETEISWAFKPVAE